MFLVVFFVTLFVEIVPGLLSGVVVSWFLALTLPYSDVPVLRTLKHRIAPGAAPDDDGNTLHVTDLVDGLTCGDDGFHTAIALLEFQLALVFSNSAKIQVWSAGDEALSCTVSHRRGASLCSVVCSHPVRLTL